MIEARSGLVLGRPAVPGLSRPGSDVWADGTNWTLGHWLNGRAGIAPLPELIAGPGRSGPAWRSIRARPAARRSAM
jgi:hypothetical protein